VGSNHPVSNWTHGVLPNCWLSGEASVSSELDDEIFGALRTATNVCSMELILGLMEVSIVKRES